MKRIFAHIGFSTAVTLLVLNLIEIKRYQEFLVLEQITRDFNGIILVFLRDKLIGYISYRIDWYSSQAKNFGLMSFDRGNPLIGKELFSIMTNLIENLKLHRIEWYMVSDNPVQRAYDRFCEKYNGRKSTLRDTFKDRLGVYHDTIIYEIITN